MQNFPVPANSIRQWTEWFRGFDGDNNILQSSDYSIPIAYINKWIQSSDGLSEPQNIDWNSFFEKHINDVPSEVLSQGQPWGALEEMLLGKTINSGLLFQLPTDKTLVYLFIFHLFLLNFYFDLICFVSFNYFCFI